MKNIKKSFALTLISSTVVLSGCASIEPVPFNGPNGKKAYSMRCSGMGRSLEACYQKAGEICPSGYSIVDRSTGAIGVPTSGGMMIAPQNTLAIECK